MKKIKQKRITVSEWRPFVPPESQPHGTMASCVSPRTPTVDPDWGRQDTSAANKRGFGLWTNQTNKTETKVKKIWKLPTIKLTVVFLYPIFFNHSHSPNLGIPKLVPTAVFDSLQGTFPSDRRTWRRPWDTYPRRLGSAREDSWGRNWRRSFRTVCFSYYPQMSYQNPSTPICFTQTGPIISMLKCKYVDAEILTSPSTVQWQCPHVFAGEYLQAIDTVNNPQQVSWLLTHPKPHVAVTQRRHICCSTFHLPPWSNP